MTETAVKITPRLKNKYREEIRESLQNEFIAIALPRDAGLQRVVDQAMALWVRSGKADAMYEQWFVKPNTASKGGLGLPMSAALKAEFDRLR